MAELFNYPAAIQELKEIVEKVENPSTSIDDIDFYAKRSVELIAKCREYLRQAKEKVDNLDV